MDISKIDLNLLVVFGAMLEHQSVTRAGEAVGLSQPAMSAAVAKLRSTFNDPLFVRAGGGMKPTPRAAELAEPVRRVLGAVKDEILQKVVFDPKTTERTFKLITPDIGEIAFLPKLLARLEREAPRANVKSLAMVPRAIEEAMESGAVDLTIGFFPDLTKAGFYQQRLFKNTFVCLVRADHPGIGDKLTLKQFLEGSHAVVRPEGRTHDLFERLLQQRGLMRRVRLDIPHFMSLPPIIAGSDLIATVPLDIGRAFTRLAKLKLVEPPIAPPVFDLKQYWHRRFHKDPANVWLRGMVHELFRD